MKKLCYGMLLYLSLCSHAFAETVIIRSADHSNFTRIALDLARPGAVKVLQDGSKISVSLPSDLNAQSEESFFRRITRDRVSSLRVAATKKSFELNLACDCAFKTFVAGSKTFVIDIVDTSPSQETEVAQLPEWAGFDRVRETPLEFNADEAGSAEIETPQLMKGTQNQDLTTRRLLDALDLVQQSQAIVQDAGTEIASAPPEQITFRSLPVIQSKAIVQIEQNAHMNLQKCTYSADLNPANWPKYDSAGEFLANQQSDIVSKFDSFEDDAIREMARAYLSLSLGAEARAVLSAVENPTQTDQLLIDVAKALDEGQTPDSVEWFQKIKNCQELLLWQILHDTNSASPQGILRQLSAEQIEDARKQFEEWPSALKGAFAPRLASAFNEFGDTDTASFTLRKTEGQPTVKTGARELVAAKISEKEGDPEKAIRMLKPVVASDADSAPEAMISIASLMAEQGVPLEAPEKAALETYQEELKGTEIEPDLLRARIVSAIQEADFETAITLIGDFAKLVRASKVNVLLDELGLGVLKLPSDTAFLKEAVSLPSGYFNEIAMETQQQIKERFIALGFEELAAQLGKNSARTREAETQRSLPQVTEATNRSALQAEETAPNASRAASEIDLASDQSRSDGEKLLTARPNAPEPQLIRNASPLSEAIGETQLVLDGMADLKDQITELGL